MLFQTRLLQSAKYLAHCCSLGTDRALCLALEGNYKDPASYQGEIPRILEALDLRNKSLDAAVDSLRDRIRSQFPKFWGGLLFAGVDLSADCVIATTAGDIRVHLIQGDALRNTREHNLLNPTEFNGYPELEEMSHDFRAEVVTRALGTERPPETITWDVRPPYSVVMCSSRVHRFREPAEYISELSRATDGQFQEGLLLVIEARSL